MSRISKYSCFLIICAFVFLGVVFLFRHSLLSILIDNKLQQYALEHLGNKIKAKNSYMHGGKWTLEEASLTDANGNLLFSADKVTVGYHLVLFDHSKFSASGFSNWLEALFNIQLKLAVNDGTLFVSNPHVPIHRINVHGAVEVSPSINGEFVFTNLDSLDHYCYLKISPSQTDLILHDIDGDAIEAVMQNFYPFMKPWRISQGLLKGQLQYAQGEISGEIQCKDIRFNNSGLSLYGHIPLGQLIVSSSHDYLFTFLDPADWTVGEEGNSTCRCVEAIGYLQWNKENGLKIELKGQFGKNEDIAPFSLISSESKSKNNFLDIEYHQLKGNLYSDHSLLQLHLTGPASDLTALMPPVFKDTLLETSTIDLKMSLALQEEPKIEGEFTITDSSSKEEKIIFGLTVDRSNPLKLQQGWFHTEDLALENYIAPLIFNNAPTHIYGHIYANGTFDANSLIVHYNAFDFLIDHPNFSFSFPSLHESLDTPLPAIHYFDFSTGLHGGTIPLHNGIYKNKINELSLNDISGQIALEKERLHAEQVEAFCEGVYLTGNCDINFGQVKAGILDLAIHVDSITSRVSQLQQVATHFIAPSFLLKLPLEGNVLLSHQGGDIQFRFQPENTYYNASVQGSLVEGNFSFPGLNLAANELSSNFKYDHNTSTLEFTDIQGVIFIDPANQAEEYQLAGDRITTVFSKFNNDPIHQVEFDIWIGDKNRDIVRLCGKTKKGEDASLVEFELNNECTHFGAIHPTNLELILKDWTQVEKANLECNFLLSTLLQDLQRLSRTGLFPMPSFVLKEINRLEGGQGDISLALNYNNDTSLLSYQIGGKNLVLGQQAFKECLLKGTKKDHIWNIDQLQFDQISFAAELATHPGQDLLDITFLGIRYGQSLLLGLSGQYSGHRLDAHVHLLEITLEHMHEWSAFSEFASQFNPKGKFNATGEMHLEWGKHLPGVQLESKFKASINSWSLNEIALNDTSHFDISIASSGNVGINNIRTGLKNYPLTSFNLANVDYHYGRHELTCNGLQFLIPAENLNSSLSELHVLFPAVFTPKLTTMIQQCKTAGNLAGQLDLIVAPNQHIAHITMQDGVYDILDNAYHLQNLSIYSDPLELRLTTQVHYHEALFNATLHSNKPTLNLGELIISDNTSKEASTQHLAILWNYDQEQGFRVNKANGECYGINMHLVENDDEGLNGDIVFDINAARPLFSTEAAAMINSWGIKGSCQFNGNVLMNTNPLFKGVLTAHNFELNGILFDTFRSNVDGFDGTLLLNNVEILDQAGTVSAETIKIKNDDAISFEIPSAAVENFKPNLLRSASNEPLTDSENIFSIPHIELNEIGGNLLQPSTFYGAGKAEYVNELKKQELPALVEIPLAIPKELLSDAGLSATVLTPMAGTIYFTIKNERILLTKLKDMYSAGRLSKFYLAKNSDPAYIDFQGNIYINLQMKQNNLLFKLAEFFTITIGGTVKHPTYSLLKQRHGSHSDSDD